SLHSTQPTCCRWYYQIRNPTMADFKTESQKFLSRSDWTLAASGGARVKLRQNGIVSLMIGPAVFLAGGWAYMKLHLFRQDYQDNFVLA
ncbi:MAG: hypothetical protein WCB15_10045, partial [Desulfobacterales bacterium]